MSDSKEKFIDEEDLKSVKEAKSKIQLLSLSLKNVELEYQNLVLGIFLKNGLSPSDSFDEQTGKITTQTEKNEQQG